MTVCELRKKLSKIPDDWEILIFEHECNTETHFDDVVMRKSDRKIILDKDEYVVDEKLEMKL